MFPPVMATFPIKIKTFAIVLAKANLAICLMLSKKAFQAEEQKESPETA